MVIKAKKLSAVQAAEPGEPVVDSVQVQRPENPGAECAESAWSPSVEKPER